MKHDDDPPNQFANTPLPLRAASIRLQGHEPTIKISVADEVIVTDDDAPKGPTVHIHSSVQIVYDITDEKEPLITLPPGTKMMRFVGAVFSRASVEHIFSPLIADYQHEYIQALARGADKRTLAKIDWQYRSGFARSILRESGPVIWKVILAIGAALKIVG